MKKLVKQALFLLFLVAVATALLMTVYEPNRAISIVRFSVSAVAGAGAIRIAYALKKEGTSLALRVSLFCLGAGLYNIVTAAAYILTINGFIAPATPLSSSIYFSANTMETIPLLCLYWHLYYGEKNK